MLEKDLCAERRKPLAARAHILPSCHVSPGASGPPATAA